MRLEPAVDTRQVNLGLGLALLVTCLFLAPEHTPGPPSSRSLQLWLGLFSNIVDIVDLLVAFLVQRAGLVESV